VRRKNTGSVPGGFFPCPVCGREDCKAYDTTQKEWRHLNFFQHEAYLHAPVPRVRCAEHGVKQVEVPWARPGSGLTVLFEAFVLALVKQMPVAAVGRLVGEHDTRLWRVLHHYLEEARGRMDVSEVKRIGCHHQEGAFSPVMDLGIGLAPPPSPEVMEKGTGDFPHPTPHPVPCGWRYPPEALQQ
jgi:hypothetical protein